MSKLSDFMASGGGKPKLITRYTSGTGTYVPTADMARCLVRIQAGGGGGGYLSGTLYGGGGGAMAEVLCRVPIAGLAYVVGAGGAGSISGAGTDGSRSSFGPYSAMPGLGGSNTLAGHGGILQMLYGSVDTDSTTVIPGSGLGGVSGGAGGWNNSYQGQLIGSSYTPGYGLSTSPAFNIASQYLNNGQGVNSGGDSFYGKGGVSAASPSAGSYGAGGGGYGGAGLGGCIEIWDFGA